MVAKSYHKATEQLKTDDNQPDNLGRPAIRLGASIAVFDKELVLLALRGKEPLKGYWSLPGGAVEIGETVMEAARRELLEETGLRAAKLSPVTRFTPHRLVDGKLVESDILLHVFATRNYCGESVSGDDAAEIQWVRWNTIKQLNITPGLVDIVTLARATIFTET